MESIERKYRVSDAVLREFTSTEIKYLEEDLPMFNAFDPDLNEEKYALLKNLYEQGKSIGSDEIQQGTLGQLTETVKVEMNKCQNIVKDVRYFAEKKFSKSPAIMKMFGFDSYEKARKSQPKLVLFMFELAVTAEKYKAELISAGLKESVITSIELAADALEKSNTTQETGKGDRLLSTEERIKLFNSIYDILVEFSDASKRVFAGNPLKKARYTLPS